MVFGIDATFELGDFYVTLTRYLNPLLRNPHSGKSPVFLGPAFIHMQHRFEDYFLCWSTKVRVSIAVAESIWYRWRGSFGQGSLCMFSKSCGPSLLPP